MLSRTHGVGCKQAKRPMALRNMLPLAARSSPRTSSAQQKPVNVIPVGWLTARSCKGGPSKQYIGRNQQGIERRCLPYRGQMVLTFTYRCPRTGLQVQGPVAADHPTDSE